MVGTFYVTHSFVIVYNSMAFVGQATGTGQDGQAARHLHAELDPSLRGGMWKLVVDAQAKRRDH